MSDAEDKPDEVESIVIPEPDPENKTEVYLHALCAMFGAFIEQQNYFMTIFTKASEPEPGKGRTVKLMDGSEIEVR